MSFSDLTLYMLDTLQAYFGPKGTNPDPNLTVEQSVASTDPFSSLAPGVNQKVILIDAPTTKESVQAASGQVYDFTDNIRLTLFIRLMTADTNAETAFTMVEALRQSVIQAVNARKGKSGVANVKLVSAPKPTMSDNTVSDTMTYEIHHFEDSFTGPNAPVSVQNAPAFAIYPGVDGKTLDTFGALGTIEVAHIGIQTNNIAPAAVTANQVDGSVEILSHKGVANGYASLDNTGKVPMSEIPATVTYPGPDNVTIDASGAGGTLEVKPNGIGATQVNSQIEQTANRDQRNGYPSLNGATQPTINSLEIPVDGTSITNTGGVLAATGGGGGGFPGVDNVTLDLIGGTGPIQVKNNSIGPSQVTPVIEQTTNKNQVGGYPGLLANPITGVPQITGSQVPIDGSTIVLNGSGYLQAQASGGYPGLAPTGGLDIGGVGGTIEIAAQGVTTNRIANDAVTSVQTDPSIEITANRGAPNGYAGLASSQLTNTLSSALQVPVDGITVKNTTGVLQAITGGTINVGYCDYVALVQPTVNSLGVTQPIVVNNQGVTIVDHNGIIRDSHAGTVNNGSSTGGIQEALVYLTNTTGEGRIRIAAGTFTCSKPITWPQNSCGIILEGSGYGFASSQQFGTVISATTNMAYLIGFGNTPTNGNQYSNVTGCLIKDIAFASGGHTFNANSNGVNAMCDFYNSNNGGTKGGIGFENLSFSGMVDGSHNDDGWFSNLIFPTGSNGMYYVSGSGSTKFYNCRFFATITVQAQQILFSDCVFTPGLVVKSLGGWQQIDMVACYTNPENVGVVQVTGTAGTTFVNCVGCHFGTNNGGGNNPWFNTASSSAQVYVTLTGCSLRNAGSSAINLIGTNVRADCINLSLIGGSAPINLNGVAYSLTNVPLPNAGWQDITS